MEGRPSAKSDAVQTENPKESESTIAQQLIRKKYKKAKGVGFYNVKDKLLNLTTAESFVDAIIISLAFLVLSLSIGFYPWPIAVALFVVVFIATAYQPFLGLVVFTFVAYPVFMYQIPTLAWAFLAGATIILIFGYMHYRVVAFIYLMVALAFSPLGYMFEIPAFIFAVITIGNKRAVLTILIALLMIIATSAITGIQNTGFIVYNSAAGYSSEQQYFGPILAVDTAARPAPSLMNFSSTASYAVSLFTGHQTIPYIGPTFNAIAVALASNPLAYIAQLAVLFASLILIDSYAIKSRSKYKGAISSTFGILYPISFIALSIYSNISPLFFIIALASFAIAPLSLAFLEYYGLTVVRSLDVRKRDVRMKFGEAFEDLSGGSSSESFRDIGNYERTKKEIKDAIIGPIEQPGIARAYNIRPVKGILLFGPPGTGKTLLMRALSNEIHAGFYSVKASSVISAFPGETERAISNMFATAKKNRPCVLFIDEIDAIAETRDNSTADDTRRHSLSQLLVEMDGFQKVSGVIIVGATNRPDLMDKAMLRPGRFDKIIYMPLPDKEGREIIFKMYLSQLPVEENIDYGKLAAVTERYSGADIKSLCEIVGQTVVSEAVSAQTILEITTDDLLRAVKSTKPSTSLSQIDEYKTFKLDFERSQGKQPEEDEETNKVAIDDVIGLAPVKKAVRENVEIPLTRPDIMKKYGVKTVNGILMFGPPGCGKTMMMRAISKSIKGVTMLELSGADLSEQGLERSTATIKEVFNRAKENAPSIVFIDEIDGIVPNRENASEFGAQLVSEVLKEIDGLKQLSDVVVIASTNRPFALDAALLRPGRFDKLIFVKPPNSTDRAKLFMAYLSNAPVGDVDYDALGTLTKGFTGADISHVCREARTAAMEVEISTGSEGKIDTGDLEAIIKNVKPSSPDSVIAQYSDFMEKFGQR